MKQTKIDNFMARLHSRTQVQDSVIKDELNLYLSDEYKDIVHYMNNAFFVNDRGILTFLRSSINQGSKADQDIRKLIYQFLSEYITQNMENLTQYIADIFKIIYGYFMFQTAAKPKQYALIPLITMIDQFQTKILLSQKVLNPQDLHNNLVNLLKCQKFAPGVKGQIWLFISTIQGKFTTLINTQRKRQVQQMCLHDLKNLINQNKNFSTISAILKSFSKSLEQVFLGDDEMKQLFRYISVLILPLAARYEVPINSMQLMSKRSGVFNKYILDNGRKVFEDLCGLLNHKNRQFTYQVNDTIDQVVKQIVRGIQSNPGKYEQLYQVIIQRSWSLLQEVGKHEITGKETQKQKYKYNIVTILKILGTISPLVKQFQTPTELQRFFNQILKKCSKKISRAFQTLQTSSNNYPQSEHQQTLNSKNKMHIKFILYNQKQLVSFISALSQIIYNIDQLTEYEQNQLIKIILISIEQYTNFLQKYVGGLIRVMVELFKVLQIKSNQAFYHLFKRIISAGFRIMLDSKKFVVNNDDQYYLMIRKSIKMWLQLINSQNWSASSLSAFGNILFQFIEHMIQHLDISYKSNLQLEIQESAQLFDQQQMYEGTDKNASKMPNQRQKQGNHNQNTQRQDIAKTFFLTSQTMRMSNIEEFQYMHSLVLVFEGVLDNMVNFNYSQRVFQFYVKAVERVRVFSKSVPLMKVIRALNNYLVKSGSTHRQNDDSKPLQRLQNLQSLPNIQPSQLSQFCLNAKKFYTETIEHFLPKHQQECLYQCLKMLTSFPVEVYYFDNCEVLKTNLSYIIKKCFEMGQQIISLANSAIDCLRRVFQLNRQIAQKYLIECIPKMQRFIWSSADEEDGMEMESSKKVYLFTSEAKVNKQAVAKKIMEFLGSIGGLVHLLVDNSNANFITWDYQDPLQIQVTLMGGNKCQLNLSRLLNRMCFLALNGQYNIKRASCQFLHSVITMVVGNAVQFKSSKQVTANFLDKVFPTVLEIASNSSHPSQQLLHTILIQSIRFFALTKQPNSPDISAILKHLLQLYNGTQDMSCLGSKCIAQLVRWHIRSDTSNKQHKNYPIVKVIMRNIWTLASNKKAKDGLILLLVELLREIHRQQDLMKHYALQICSIVINIGRSNQPVQKEFSYLVQKLVLSLNKVIRKLIIQNKKEGDQYNKYPTIHSFLSSVYETNFFSIYSQQREISFILWKQIITKYSQVLNYTCLDFLKNRADRVKLYLFSKLTHPLNKFEERQDLGKSLSKLIAYCDIWRKLLQFNINSAQNLVCFKDIQEIVAESYVNFTNYFIFHFSQLPTQQRCLNEQFQKNIILSIKSFPSLLKQFKISNKNTADWLQQRLYYLLITPKHPHLALSLSSYILFVLKVVIKPNAIVPNFDYDLFEQQMHKKNNTNIKDNLALPNGKDLFQKRDNNPQFNFTELMIQFLFDLVQKHQQSQQQNILEIFFQAIESLYYCTQKKLVLFLFARSQMSQHRLYGFSASLAEQQHQSSRDKEGSYIYERQIKAILKTMLVMSRYYPRNYPKFTNIIHDMIRLLDEDESVGSDKGQMIIQTILGFSGYEIVREYFLKVIGQMGQVYMKFQRLYNNFLLRNFQLLADDLFLLLNRQPKVLKLFYFLKSRLSQQNLVILNRLWIQKVPQILQLSQKNQSDSYRLHYFFVQSTSKIQDQRQYLSYICHLIKQGLSTSKTSQVHFLTINLASITLNKLKTNLKQSLYLQHQVKTTFDRCLTSVSNYYVPFTLGELEKEQHIMNAQKYLKTIQNMIYLIDDYSYIVHLFVGFKDMKLRGRLKKVHDSCVEGIIARYYANKQYEEQMAIAEWILSYYENEQLNNRHNVWNSFRLAIIERFFVKLIHFTKKKVLILLFKKYTPMLLGIITQKVSPKNIQDMVSQFQIKEAAFIIIQHLYMYLPKPQKDKSLQRIHNQQYHKRIIVKVVEVLKNKFDNSSMILMNEHDKSSKDGQNEHKALQIFRNYMCSAYNCLIVVFISTQSKVDHFKKYLFDKGEVLWEHLVDPTKVNYHFPIQTEFQVMKAVQAISKYQLKGGLQLQRRIRDQYMQSSLYVIDQQLIPQSQGHLDQEQPQSPSHAVRDQVRQGSIQKVLRLSLEEDYINRHPCMVNMLRVIDYMDKQFSDGNTPSWMKAIYDQLMIDDLPLSVRILLTKIILNRQELFTQAIMWGQCVIKYLCSKQNGGNFIHYYYRDALLLLIRYIRNGFRPKAEQTNFILMKLIRCLPHDKDVMIYSSNIDIMEQLMKLVPDIYVEKTVVTKMLSSVWKKNPQQKTQSKQLDPQYKQAEKFNQKNRFQWRMCACIVMKSCLQFKVPIMSEQEWKKGKANNKDDKFYFFIQCVRHKILKVVEELLYQNAKKYRITASALFGQMLRFFNQKTQEYVIQQDDKAALMQYIKDVLNKIYGREENRATKQRLSLVFSNIIIRYPMILADTRLFGILDSVIVKYKQDERFKMIQSAIVYLNSLLNLQQKSYGFSVELMQTVRSSIQKFIADNFQVYKITIKLLKMFAKQFFLDNKQIFLAIYSIFDILNKNYSNCQDEGVCVDYFELVLLMKDYIGTFNEDALRLKPYITNDLLNDFKAKIKQSLIGGLGSKFNLVRKNIIQHFEQTNNNIASFQTRIIQLLKQIYIGPHENLWIVNSIPLIFSMARKSSNYNDFLYNKQIEQSAQFYDVDFKNISFHNSSQPYTPAYSFLPNSHLSRRMSESSQENGSIPSIGSNRLGGIIKATQNSYLSQQDQVFTILASQSQEGFSLNQSQRMIELQTSSLNDQKSQQQRNYTNLNNIFMSYRRRTKPNQANPNKNTNKYDSHVNATGNRIRFKPKQRQVQTSHLFRGKKVRQVASKASINRNNRKIHSSYRSYKVGEMPNVQISLAHVLQPLVQVCCFDKQLASQFFTIFLAELISKKKSLQKTITDWFIQLLQDSKVYDFSFISTLQKCLISICQQGSQMIRLNMNQIAIKSNTVDYGIVFTEQNLIKHRRMNSDQQKLSILIQDQDSERFVESQWSDLIDLYQRVSGHAFLPPMLKNITKEGQYEHLLKTLAYKQSGSISECYKQLQQLMKETSNSRLHDFLQKEKIDCLALLGEWEPVTASLQAKLNKSRISDEQKRLLTLSLLNSQNNNRDEMLQRIKFPDEKFNYQKALVALMNYNTDLADYFSGKQIDNFYKFFKKTTSFDFNTKHCLLENIQKVFQMRQFLSIYKNKEPSTVQILNVMNRWAKRLPNQMFDSNLTWIQLLESRMFFTSILNNKFSIPKQKVAKANTDYMIQVVNQMLKKNIYGCAQVITKKALTHMKASQIFNWAFYEALSDLKLFQYKKKVIISSKVYEIVPKVIQKELKQSKKTDFYSDIKQRSIQNEHMEGFLQSCTKAMMCDTQIKPNIQEMVQKTSKIHINYEKIKKSFKNLINENRVEKLQLQKMQCNIHFKFSLFLENILELTRGRLQVRQIGELMEKSNLPLYRMTENYALELIETISLMNLSGVHAVERSMGSQKGQHSNNSGMSLNYKEKELNEHKVFSLILKLLKIIQSEKKKVGQIFSESINDRKLPIWIFVYFIPQIIRTLNSFQLVQYFNDLFYTILQMYPQSLVYHFNCYYEKKIECLTKQARQIYDELHRKLDVNFKFIDALELLYHPEKRLRQILQGFSRPGDEQVTNEELQEFITVEDKRLGKYNKKFIEQHKPFIRKIINMKRQHKSSNAANAQIQKLARMLDPKSNGQKIQDFSKLSDGSLFFQEYNCNDWRRIQVPATIYCRFQQPLSWNRVFIQSFEQAVLTLNSQRRPKRVTLYGSNEKKYMFLVKGGEDVRLDQRIQELFNIINKVLRNDGECAKKKLQIRRFQVIPIKKMLGVFEWVDDTQTLKQVLEKQLRILHPHSNFAQSNLAYKQYIAKVKSSARTNARDNASLYKQFLCLPQQQITANLKNCQAFVPFGLLRKTLLRLSKSYDFYLHIKNQFLSNYAVVCMVGYVLGIGDRHLQNFLIHGASASVILIDFGSSFGSSRDLAVPQLIPFRLTKSFLQIMEPIGYQGIFKQAMISSFSALQDSKNVIIDFCDVFIDDPLMEWIWKCKKQIPTSVINIPEHHISMTFSQQPPERKVYSKRIEIVQKKLMGQHPRKILIQQLQQSKHKQAKFYDGLKVAIWKGSKTKVSQRGKILDASEIAQELITLASDKNILGRCYVGLNPFV